ncbi:hypothetical protein MTR67_031511, partial [Solanum verrucosum]
MDAGHGLMHSGLGLGTTDGSSSSRASNNPFQTKQGGSDSMDNMNMANTNTAGISINVFSMNSKMSSPPEYSDCFNRQREWI